MMIFSRKNKVKNKFIASSYMLPIVEYAKQAGLDTDYILEKAKFDPAGFNKKKHYMTYDQYLSIVSFILNHVKNKQFGLEIVSTSTVTTHAALGLSILTSLNFESALKLSLKFYRLRMQLVDLNYEKQGLNGVIQLLPNLELNDTYQFTMEMIASTIMHMKSSIWEDSDLMDTVYFTFPEPDDLTEYKKVFKCNLVFNHDCNQIVFPLSDLKKETPLADSDSFEHLTMAISNEYKAFEGNATLSDKISDYCWQCEDEYPSLIQMAALLHTSERTLRRHLQQEGTTYQQIVTEVRLSKAKELLQNTDYSITTIALQLGFSDAANFSRAFKTQMKMTPKTFRDQLH